MKLLLLFLFLAGGNEPTVEEMLRSSMENLKRTDARTLWANPKKRSPLIEAELTRQIEAGGWKNFQTNVEIQEVRGNLFVSRIGLRHAGLQGRVVTEFDVVQLQPGRRLEPGHRFDPKAVTEAWELKTGEIHSGQIRVQAGLLGRFPRVIQINVPGFLLGQEGWLGEMSRYARIPWHPLRRFEPGVVSTARFGAAALLDATLDAAVERRTLRVGDVLEDVLSPESLGSAGVFAVVSRGVSRGWTRVPPLRRVSSALPRFAQTWTRSAIPMAAGVAASQVVFGRWDPVSGAVSTTSLLISDLVAGRLLDAAVYPMLFTGGMPGWLASEAYAAAKLGFTLHLAGRMEKEIHKLLPRRDPPRREQEHVLVSAEH